MSLRFPDRFSADFFTGFFSKRKKGPEEQPDLFEWAGAQTDTDTGKRKIAAFLFFATGGIVGFVIACFLCGGSNGTLSKEGEIIRKDGTRVSGIIEAMADGRLKLRPNDPAEGAIELDLDSIERIVFVETENKAAEESELSSDTEQKQASIRELTLEEKRFLGRYWIQVSGHSGNLVIYRTRTGYLGAAIRFQTWGKKELEYLKRVYVRGNQIYFIRSCTGADCSRIGAGSPFRQEYQGEMSLDGRKINGNYKGGQNASRWEAVRK